MVNRRAQIAMSADEAERYLAGQPTLVVATIGPSGHPHVVAMWFALLEGKVAFWTFAKSQKIANLRRDPRITGLVESGESYGELRGVELVGVGRIVPDEDQVRAIGAAVWRKMRPDADPTALDAHVIAQAGKRVGVILEAERMVSWDHTKLERA